MPAKTGSPPWISCEIEICDRGCDRASLASRVLPAHESMLKRTPLLVNHDDAPRSGPRLMESVMDCAHAHDLIDGFVGDELAPEDARLLADHLRGCPSCSAECNVEMTLLVWVPTLVSVTSARKVCRA